MKYKWSSVHKNQKSWTMYNKDTFRNVAWIEFRPDYNHWRVFAYGSSTVHTVRSFDAAKKLAEVMAELQS